MIPSGTKINKTFNHDIYDSALDRHPSPQQTHNKQKQRHVDLMHFQILNRIRRQREEKSKAPKALLSLTKTKRNTLSSCRNERSYMFLNRRPTTILFPPRQTPHLLQRRYRLNRRSLRKKKQNRKKPPHTDHILNIPPSSPFPSPFPNLNTLSPLPHLYRVIPTNSSKVQRLCRHRSKQRSKAHTKWKECENKNPDEQPPPPSPALRLLQKSSHSLIKLHPTPVKVSTPPIQCVSLCAIPR